MIDLVITSKLQKLHPDSTFNNDLSLFQCVLFMALLFNDRLGTKAVALRLI